MTIDLPFKPGDKVWVADHCFQYTREVTCLFCKQTGEVLLSNGTKMRCGICMGRTTHCINRPFMARPELHTITGFDIHNKNSQLEVWWYTDRSRNFVCTADLCATFYEARKRCQAFNKKYKWPKKDYVTDTYEDRRMYWGYRVGRNKKD